MQKLDSAVLAALSLRAGATKTSSHGSSGFSSTFKIETESPDGKTRWLFMKTGKGTGANVMFRGMRRILRTQLVLSGSSSRGGIDKLKKIGEYESLNAIHDAVPSLCPRAVSYGTLRDSQGYYLVTDFVDFSTASTRTRGAESLASKIAKLHSAPAPEKYGGRFGFPVSTCCGSTVQDNTWEDSWAEFFGKRRLIRILEESEKNNGADRELRVLVEKTVDLVVPRLLGRLKDVRPVLVHGDLWSGNASRGVMRETGDSGKVEEVVFDPSVCYAHNEYEFGIMKMFGGFGSVFFDEYHKAVPKAEPVEEYGDRVKLYQLYHQLNHHALFAGGYRGGAISAMESLCSQYGGGK